MSLEKSFRGKRVLVTGAGRGIGLAVSKRLHSYGAVVIAVGRNPSNLLKLEESCPGIQTIVADLSNWEETRTALNPIPAVDVLLNNAGTGMVQSLMKSTLDEFEQIFNVNVKGTWNVSQIMARKMVDAGKGGSICFISSICGGKPFPLFGAYCMSKSALEMMASCLAVELGSHKIRVNVVRPASVDTDLLEIAEKGVALATAAGGSGNGEKAFEGFMVGRTPYPYGDGYHMEMEGLVNLILFAMSPDLAPQMTGSVLTMDGGFQLT